MAKRLKSGAAPPPVKGILQRIPVDHLLLDKDNARLASSAQTANQDEMTRILWSEMAVNEVALSVAANGYYDEEPLLVIPEKPGATDPKTDTFIVIEGNRRLAAVRLLRDEALRQKVKALELPAIDADRRKSLDELPVLMYPNREVLWSYLGFRHINGAQDWDAFSKAKYVADVHEKYNVPLDEIAQKIGDSHRTVLRLYRGYKVLQQAEEQAGFDKEDRIRNKFFFSHLYTATDQTEFQNFLGINRAVEMQASPVPKKNLGNLKELMTWLYGRKSSGTTAIVQKQNPDLGHLGEVISKPNSLAAIRAGYSLSKSYEISIGDVRRFRDSLVSSKEELQQAKATVTTGYRGESDLIELVDDIIAYASGIKEEMVKIRASASGRKA